MYCTGGIRCEHASSYIKHKGVNDVSQLHGGIHKYAEQYPDGFFRGKNFIFDNRQSLKVTDDVLTNCEICGIKYDKYIFCNSNDCYKYLIICPKCQQEKKGEIYCCNECKENGAMWTKKYKKIRHRPFRKKEKKFRKLTEKQLRLLERLQSLDERITALE